MIWWLRQRGALGLLPGALLAFVLGVGVTGGVTLVLPAFIGHYATVTELSNFVSLIPSVCLIACLERRMSPVERSAVRRLDARDVTLVSGCALLATASAAALALLGSAAALTAARNNLLFCGLALGAWPLMGHRAPLLSVFWMIQAMFLGGRTRDDPYPWVIVTEESHVPHAALGAAAVFLTGLVSLICFAPRTDR
ncbi:hypothetical protein N4P33_04310 [Streptomyces sp. 15-116A]|uniref:hypothetical protein n=1 Tax=Streptomyces sp. 15-116A TaxID=2259035 RepID=UPI0021B197A7|nr:hypothetical protein [Streptomyces sp. 15-116A]MCT7351393.1 hypothetical protein [Streptomyces sp. 15-116A]